MYEIILIVEQMMHLLNDSIKTTNEYLTEIGLLQYVTYNTVCKAIGHTNNRVAVVLDWQVTRAIKITLEGKQI